MSKRSGAQGYAPERISHEVAMQHLLAYSYGRLTPDQEKVIEAHVRSCSQCRAEGVEHIARERIHAMQQRPRSRRANQRPVIITLSVILGLLIGSAGFLLFTANRNGSLTSTLSRGNSAKNTTPVANLTPTAAATPVALQSQTPYGDKGVVVIATSPDGAQVAVGTNPSDLGGSGNGGVTIYTDGNFSKQLYGFEGFQSPGSLAWSPDGGRLAASGRLTLYLWNTGNGAATTIALPATPGNNLYVFDASSGDTVMSAPPTIFAATGFVQWGQDGKIASSPAGSGEISNVPSSTSPVLALWGGQQGIRLFRDGATTLIGVNDADIEAHAAYLRWSPDGRFILWGYPRLPIGSTLLSTGGTAPVATGTPTDATAVNSPDVAFATLVNKVGQAADAGANVVIWPANDGQRLAVLDNTTATPTLSIVDASTGGAQSTFTGITASATIPLNALSWQKSDPIKVTLTTGQDAITPFAAGT